MGYSLFQKKSPVHGVTWIQAKSHVVSMAGALRLTELARLGGNRARPPLRLARGLAALLRLAPPSLPPPQAVGRPHARSVATRAAPRPAAEPGAEPTGARGAGAVDSLDWDDPAPAPRAARAPLARAADPRARDDDDAPPPPPPEAAYAWSLFADAAAPRAAEQLALYSPRALSKGRVARVPSASAAARRALDPPPAAAAATDAAAAGGAPAAAAALDDDVGGAASGADAEWIREYHAALRATYGPAFALPPPALVQRQLDAEGRVYDGAVLEYRALFQNLVARGLITQTADGAVKRTFTRWVFTLTRELYRCGAGGVGGGGGRRCRRARLCLCASMRSLSRSPSLSSLALWLSLARSLSLALALPR
jgi:hypothetical protein